MDSRHQTQSGHSHQATSATDRRTFLKGSGAALAGLGVAALTAGQSARADQPAGGAARTVGVAPSLHGKLYQPITGWPDAAARLSPQPVLTLRQQDELTYSILEKRLNTVVPTAMREAGLDMWLILCEEDAYDPVHTSMTPMKTWRPILQMLLFFDRGPEKGVERINLSMTKMRGLFEQPWEGRRDQEQWVMLRQLIEERDPRRIGIHTGEIQWLAGGLTGVLERQLRSALLKKYVDRLESAETTATVWGQTLIQEEIDTYRHVIDVAHGLIAECYSHKAITPGKTTIDDLVWFHAQRCAESGMEIPFPAYFRRYRNNDDTARFGEDDLAIRPGDLIRCDIGIKYLRLISDQQQWAYILRPGETEAPEPMRQLMAQTGRLQKIFMDEFRAGRTGNEMLAAILARARREEVPNPKVYSHSIGIFLHEPGPLIGLPWEQERCQGRGDVRLRENTAFAMELSAGQVIPGWGKEVFNLPLEEEVVFTKDGCRPVSGMQTGFYLV